MQEKISGRAFLRTWTGLIFVGLVCVVVSLYPTFRAERPAALFGAFLLFVLASGLLLRLLFTRCRNVQQKLARQSTEDPLTGLKNVRHFRRSLQLSIQRFHQHDQSFAVALLDLNDFEKYNRRLGHPGGDKVLRQVARCLDENSGDHDPPARYGGDEFILMLPGTTYQEAKRYVEQLCRSVEEAVFEVDCETVSLSMSAGIAFCPEDGESEQDIVRAADRNLHRAKSSGLSVFTSRTIDSAQDLLQSNRPLAVHSEGDYLDKVAKKTTEMYLLAKNDDLEIIKQTIAPDKMIQIQGADDESFEFFYLLEGEVLYPREDLVLKPGDFISVQSAQQEEYFKTLTQTTFLDVTTTAAFKSKQKQIRRLLSLNREVAKKDQQTDEHSRRLQELSRRTGEELGLSERALFSLGYASFLHDIGKAEVPASILSKPGELTEDEWEIIKQHPRWGRDLILEHLSSSLFERVAEIVYQHHERYDGRGYPRGLKGEEIAVEAQILATVDAYDAMLHDRPYRDAMPRQEALQELKQHKGKQFTPQVVEAFLRAEEEFYCSSCQQAEPADGNNKQ